MQKETEISQEKDAGLGSNLINSAFKFAFTSASAFVALHYNSRLMAHNQEVYRHELNLQRATQVMARRLTALEDSVQEILTDQNNYSREQITIIQNSVLQLEQEIINTSTPNSFYIQHWLDRTNKLLIELDKLVRPAITNSPRP